MVEQSTAAERRRKKIKDGEEDSISVAQRFLNIYRQLHIFTPDKKAAFDKMLLELPIDVKNAFGNLPGGSMVQDYIYDLEEGLGIEEDVSAASEEQQSKSNILEAALAESSETDATDEIPATSAASVPPVQPQVQTPQPIIQPQIINTAMPSKLEIGGNFASELAAALGTVLKDNRPAAPVPGNIETSAKVELGKDFASGLAEAMAAALKQNQPEPAPVQQADAPELGKEFGEALSQSLASALKEAIPSQTGELKEMLASIEKNHSQVVEMLRQDTSQNRSEMQNLTQMVVRGQMHLAKAVAGSKANFDDEGEDKESKVLESLNTTQQLIAKALVGLTQVQKKDNDELTQTLVKSQQEMVRMLMQNNTVSSANNANNIQINTPDNSAQMHVIVDKLSSMQEATSKNFEQMMEKMVQAQSELYRNIAETQTKELSAIITVALKESQRVSTENIITAMSHAPHGAPVAVPVYYPQPSQTPQNFYTQVPNAETMLADTADYQTNDFQAPYSFSPEEDISQEKNTMSFYNDDTTFTAPEELSEESLELLHDDNVSVTEDIPFNVPVETETTVSEDDENLVKKKKKKKKKKNKTTENEITLQEPQNLWLKEPVDNEEMMTEVVAQDDNSGAFLTPDNDFLPDLDFTNLPEESGADFLETAPVSESEEITPSQSKTEIKHIWDIDIPELNQTQDMSAEDLLPQEPIQLTESSDDWGWISTPDNSAPDNKINETILPESAESFGNDNFQTEEADIYGEEGEDWVWEYEEDDESNSYANDDFLPAEANFATANLKPLGNYTLLCSGDLYFQKDVFKKLEQQQVDFDLFDASSHIMVKNLAAADENEDPYENSDSKD